MTSSTIDIDWKNFTAFNGSLDVSMLYHSPDPGGLDTDILKVCSAETPAKLFSLPHSDPFTNMHHR